MSVDIPEPQIGDPVGVNLGNVMKGCWCSGRISARYDASSEVEISFGYPAAPDRTAVFVAKIDELRTSTRARVRGWSVDAPTFLELRPAKR